MNTKSSFIHELNPTISIVVIGRNSEAQLRKIYDHHYLAQLKKQADELIYVDSDSSDGSVHWMKSCGFDTISLLPTGRLTAAAGRNIGTEKAQSRYVLYLDSDMKLDNIGLFFDYVRELLVDKPHIVGLVGNVIDCYPDGKQRKRLRKPYKNGSARTFGGFVILDRNEVLSVGNWTSSLASLEEQELYSRLLANKKFVYFLPEVSVHHLTVVPNQFVEITSVYLPLRGKHYGGLGKAIRHGFWRKRTFYLLQMNREIILFATLLIILLSGNLFWIFVFGLIYQIDLLKRRSWKYNFVVPGMLVATFIGFFSPMNVTEPHVKK